jgi:hypothetical protein
LIHHQAGHSTALKGPIIDGKAQDGSELYVILPPGGEDAGWNHYCAYCKDARFGRMVVVQEGYSHDVSEARFRQQMSRQGQAIK